MRDSALKLLRSGGKNFFDHVGEELMRDSALKREDLLRCVALSAGRRRAHARQRFETERSQ